MRINEINEPAENALFEGADVDKVLNVAVSGEQVWSKPMSLEQAIEYTLSLGNAGKRNDNSNQNL